jgi:hypothetical protein
MAHDWSDMDAPDDRGCVIADCRIADGVLVCVEYRRVVFSDLPRFVSDPARARAGVDFVLPLAGVDFVLPLAGEPEEAEQEPSVTLEQTYDAGTILEAYLRDRYGLDALRRLSAEQEALLAVGYRLMAGEEEP